jgi:hypothetical protein
MRLIREFAEFPTALELGLARVGQSMRFVVPLIAGGIPAALLILALYQPATPQALLIPENGPVMTVLAMALVGFAFLVQEMGAWVFRRFQRY